MCAYHPRAKEKPKIERHRGRDGRIDHKVDFKAASAIYLVECRARQDDVVVCSVVTRVVHNAIASDLNRLF